MGFLKYIHFCKIPVTLFGQLLQPAATLFGQLLRKPSIVHLVVEVVEVAADKDVDVPHDLENVKTLEGLKIGQS